MLRKFYSYQVGNWADKLNFCVNHPIYAKCLKNLGNTCRPSTMREVIFRSAVKRLVSLPYAKNYSHFPLIWCVAFFQTNTKLKKLRKELLAVQKQRTKYGLLIVIHLDN